MRLCMGSIRSFGSVVMIVKLSTLLPSGLHHTSHNPARAKGSLLFRRTQHWDLTLSFFPPLVETVSGNDTTASIDEGFEGRQFRQGFGTGVYHAIADGGVCGLVRNQSPVHEPALVSTPVADDDGESSGKFVRE